MREADALLLHLARRTWDADVAMDLTAETFARAFAGRARFRGDTVEEERAYLYGIAHNLLANLIRKGVAERRAVSRLAIEVPRLAPDEIAEIEARAGMVELRKQVRAELERLPGRNRDALRLRVVDELGYPEVARRLSITEQAARARVSRGLRALSIALEGAR